MPEGEDDGGAEGEVPGAGAHRDEVERHDDGVGESIGSTAGSATSADLGCADKSCWQGIGVCPSPREACDVKRNF